MSRHLSDPFVKQAQKDGFRSRSAYKLIELDDRFRFLVPGEDGRPMTFPPEGPFWITGQSETHTVVVAFSPDLATLTCPGRWPDAEDVEDQGEQEIEFSGRFQKPDWWEARP